MTEDKLEGVHPTRMELLKLKNRLRRAEKGHRLLKEKRDNLVMEFMNIAKNASEVSDRALEQLMRADRAKVIAYAVCGARKLRSTSIATGQDIRVELEYKNIMGIKLPQMKIGSIQRKADMRGVGLTDTEPSIQECAKEYESALENLIALAESQSSLIALSNETKKTKRRVNALEYKLIPRLKNTRKYIIARLEELEREGFYSRKMVKKKQMGASA